MMYLIGVYCLIFVYSIFLLTVKETFKRYFSYIEHTAEEIERNRSLLHNMQVNIIRGRSWRDHGDALAYCLFIMSAGRIGTQSERDYIAAERAGLQYRHLSGAIKDYCYDED